MSEGRTGWPFVSVIVPVYNDPGQLERCIAALHGQNYAGATELIVVDNGSDPPLPDRQDGVHLLCEPHPGSYHARNTALARARGAMIAFTDADCVPHAGWLSAAVKQLAADPTIAAVGGRVRIMPFGDARPSIAELYETAVAFPQEIYIARSGFAATANLIVRGDVMAAVGDFDASLRSGGDLEWGQRLHGLGYRLAYCADAVVDHPARSHREVMQKIRRTTGGARDRDAGWASCLRFCVRFAIPPRKRIMAIIASRAVTVSPVRRARVVAYATMVNWATAYHRLRLQLRGDVSAR